MIDKIFSLGDWIFNHPVRLLVAAAVWFTTCIAGAFLGANALNLLKTPIDWLIGAVVGVCIGILLPVVALGLVEAIREAENEREREEEWDRLQKKYE